MIRSEFGLDYTKSGLLVAAFAIPYGISQVPAGWLTDRIGARTIFTVSICGVAAAGLLVGLSNTYIMILIFLAVMGVLGGGYHPASSQMVAASVDPKRRGWALGFHNIGGIASFFLSPLIVAAIATIVGWRGSFIGLAIPAIIFGIIFYFLLRRMEPIKQARSQRTTTHIETPPPPGHLRRLIALISLNTITWGFMLATISLIPLFLVDRFGISKGAAAAFISLFFSAGLWAGPPAGYLSDRWGRIPVSLAACFMAGPVIYLLNLAPHGWGIGAVLLTMGMITFTISPAAQAYIADHVSERNQATVFGIYFFGNQESAGVIAPVLGYLIDHFGFYSSFAIASATMLTVATICSIFLWGSRD